MNQFLANPWTKRVVSLLSVVYCALVVMLSYYSIFYDLLLRDSRQTCIFASLISVIALIIMLYTRETFLTKLSSVVILAAMLCPILFYFGQWWILVPPFVVGVIIFLFSGMGETGKTIWGTIILLLYLIGSLIYFVTTSLFAPSTVTTVVQTGNSPSGAYRYTVTQTMDSSNGSTKVSVESNELNEEYFGLLEFRVTGLSRDVMIERPLNENVDIRWETASREDITKELSKISKDITVTLSDQQMNRLGRDAYQVNYPDGTSVSLSPEEYHALMYPLTAEDKEVLKLEEDEMHVDVMGERSFRQTGVSVDDLRTVKLLELTESDLDKLGIPTQGDVMYYNDKIVFRYYIAELEEYFDISKQEIGLFN